MAFLPTPVPMPIRPAATPLAGAAPESVPVSAPGSAPESLPVSVPVSVPGSAPESAPVSAPVSGGVPGQAAADASRTGFATLLATLSPGTELDILPSRPVNLGPEAAPGPEVAAPVLLAMAVPAMSPPDVEMPPPMPDGSPPMSAESAAPLAVAAQMEGPAFVAEVAPSPLGVTDPATLAAPPALVPAAAAGGLKGPEVTPIPPSGVPAAGPAVAAGVRSLRGAIIEIPAGPDLPDPGTAGIRGAASQPTATAGMFDTASPAPLPGPAGGKPATDLSTGTGEAAADVDPAAPPQSAAEDSPTATGTASATVAVPASPHPATPVAPAALLAADGTQTQANDTSTGTAPPPSLRPDQPAGSVQPATARPGAHETAAAPAAKGDNGFGQAGNGPSAAMHAPTGGVPAQGAAPSFAEQLAAMRTGTGLPTQPAPGSEANPAATPSDASHGGSDPLAGMKSLPVPNAPPGGSTHGAGTTPSPSMPHTAPAPAPAVPVSLGIAKALADGKSRITVRLDPPELGRVEVRLDFAGDGTVRAMIRADSHHALELLQRDARHLERALTDSGLRADSGSLSFSLNQNGQQHADLAGGSFGGRHGHDPAGGEASPDSLETAADPLVEPAPEQLYSGTASGGVNLVI